MKAAARRVKLPARKADPKTKDRPHAASKKRFLQEESFYLTALTETLDPHSTYMAPARQDNFEIDLSNSVEGIGAVLRKIDEYTTIESIGPGGQARESEEEKCEEALRSAGYSLVYVAKPSAELA